MMNFIKIIKLGETMDDVGVIGAGSLGTALAQTIAQNVDNVILHLSVQQAVFHGNNKELVFGDIEEDDDTAEMIDGIKV